MRHHARREKFYNAAATVMQVNIKEKYDMERMKYAPTFVSERDYKILRMICKLTFLHLETLAIFAFLREIDVSFFAGVEIVIPCILIAVPIEKGFWKKFGETYAVAETKDFSYVRTRAMKEAV